MGAERGGGGGSAGRLGDALGPGDGDVHQELDEHGLGAPRERREGGAELVVVLLQLFAFVALEGIKPSPVAE